MGINLNIELYLAGINLGGPNCYSRVRQYLCVLEEEFSG